LVYTIIIIGIRHVLIVHHKLFYHDHSAWALQGHDGAPSLDVMLLKQQFFSASGVNQGHDQAFQHAYQRSPGRHSKIHFKRLVFATAAPPDPRDRTQLHWQSSNSPNHSTAAPPVQRDRAINSSIQSFDRSPARYGPASPPQQHWQSSFESHR
jgi:hypothetical protein